MIHVSELSYTYPGSKIQALEHVSFDIEAGQIFGFLGPSGAGKSTCQKILYRILQHYDGVVLINGQSLRDVGSEYYEQIGVGFELPNHYLKLTGRENLALFGSFYSPSKLANPDLLFERVDLAAFADQKVETYSKGMKMRLNFIRALMHDPQILFLDEPTAGLDPVNALIIKTWIRELRDEGKTIFLTTHDMTTADELCDRISLIVQGKIATTETPEVLKKAHGKNEVSVHLASGQHRNFDLAGLGSNAEFLAFIQSDAVRQIRTMDATLEEAFIAITGQSLTDG